MNESHGSLEHFGTALRAGDRDDVMSCFAADATLVVMSGDDHVTLTGNGIGEAVDVLLAGFDDLRMTPTSRVVSKTGAVVEQVVMSGNHTGAFAGAEPTSRRVRVNVQLSATWGQDSTLEFLSVEADTRALFAQLSENGDVIGVTGGLIALARERHDGELHVTDENGTSASSAQGAASGANPPASRRRWVVAMAIAAALIAAALSWRGASATADQDGARATRPAASATSATPPKVTVPKPIPVVQPTRVTRPVIVKTNPKKTPHVQAGKQVILRSDVLFSFDSSALTPAATAALVRLSRQIRGSKVTGTIQINGYTDNSGAIAYDIALSRTRAIAVARVLQKALVGSHVTLVPQGFGHGSPIASNTTEAGRTRNRRVTVVLPVLR